MNRPERESRTGHPLRVGLDIGGTSMTAGLVAPDRTIRHREDCSTPAAAGPDAVLDAAAELVRRCDPEAGRDGVGIGATGVIDPHTGRVLAATSAMPGWEGTDLIAGLRARLGPVPVQVVNDVHAFALGEWSLGAGRDHGSLLAVTLGTGVGGAFVIDGRLLLGRHAAAGHIGHLSVPQAAGVPCPCGSVGHLEAVAGAPRLMQQARTAGVSCAGLPELMEQAGQGRQPASEVVTCYASAVGTAIADVVATLAPDVVVLGGGVSRAGRLVLDQVAAAFRERVLPLLADVPVLTSTLGEDAVLVGAVLAEEHLDGHEHPDRTDHDVRA